MGNLWETRPPSPEPSREIGIALIGDLSGFRSQWGWWGRVCGGGRVGGELLARWVRRLMAAQCGVCAQGPDREACEAGSRQLLQPSTNQPRPQWHLDSGTSSLSLGSPPTEGRGEMACFKGCKGSVVPGVAGFRTCVQSHAATPDAHAPSSIPSGLPGP